jgi:PAS domain S-box-containing protein
MRQSSFPASLFNPLRELFQPPAFFPDQEDKTRIAIGLHTMLLVNSIIALLYSVIVLLTAERKIDSLIIFALTCGIMYPLMILNFQGRTRFASITYVVYFWVLISFTVLVSGGLSSVVISFYIPIVIITLLLLGWRAGLVSLGTTFVYTFLIARADLSNLPNYLPSSTDGQWFALGVALVMIIIPIYRIQREMLATLDNAHKQLAERHKIEQTLAQSEERFRLISSVTSDYTFSSHVEQPYGITRDEYNGAFEKITGYTPEEYTSIGGWLAIVHPEHREQDARDMATLRQNKSVITELRIIRKDEQICWVRVYGYPVWDAAQQKLIGIYGAVQDITERKLAEQALIESENRYRVISEIISDYAYAYDIHPDGSYSSYWITEDSFIRLTGYTWIETGTSLKLYHPDDRSLIEEHIKQTVQGNPMSGEYRIITKSGEVRWVAIKRQVEWDDEEKRYVRFYGAAQDITERIQAQAALAQDRKLLRTVIDNIPNNVFVKDVNGKFLLNNRESMRLLMVSRQEDLIGKSDFDFLPADLSQMWAEEQQRIMQNDVTVIDQEVYQPWRPTERRYLLYSAIPLHNERGEVIGMIGIDRDVTQAKNAERAIREKEAFLRALLDATPDVAFLMNTNGELLTVNKPLATSLGSTVEELLGKNGFVFLKDEMRTERERQFKECLATRKPVRWEDGRNTIWWSNSFYPVLSESGEVEAVAGYGKDITEERRLSAELQRYTTQLETMVNARTGEVRRAKEQIEIILNNTRDAIALAQTNGDIETRNPAFVTMFGEQASNWIERLTSMVASTDQSSQVGKTLLNTIHNREGARIELQITSESGETRDIDLAFIPVQLTSNQDQ